MKPKKICALFIAATTLVGCAGRDPQPVAVVQPGDSSLDCPAIQAEVTANNRTIQDLGSEEGGKVAQNVAAGVVGLVVWPVWFAMDFKGAAGKEEAALESRQQYLATLAMQRGCGNRPMVAAAPAASPPSMPIPSAVPAPVPPAPPVMPAATPQQVWIPEPCGGEDHPCSATTTSASLGH